MDPLDCPFRGTAEVLARYRLGASVQAIVADIHAEASSEKMAYGHIFDGQVSFVVGTHTHCPTADAQILPGGTAFQSDAGMCGDYDSVIGMVKERRDAALLAQDAGREAGPGGRRGDDLRRVRRNRRRHRAGAPDRAGPHRRAAGPGNALDRFKLPFDPDRLRATAEPADYCNGVSVNRGSTALHHRPWGSSRTTGAVRRFLSRVALYEAAIHPPRS